MKEDKEEDKEEAKDRKLGLYAAALSAYYKLEIEKYYYKGENKCQDKQQ